MNATVGVRANSIFKQVAFKQQESYYFNYIPKMETTIPNLESLITENIYKHVVDSFLMVDKKTNGCWRGRQQPQGNRWD